MKQRKHQATLSGDEVEEELPKDDGGRIDYRDDDVTRRYRDEVHRINRWLDAAKLEYEGSDAAEYRVDITDRRLRRIFNGSFESGGDGGEGSGESNLSYLHKK